MAQKKLKPAAVILVLALVAVTWWLENRQKTEQPTGPSAGAPPAEADALRQAVAAKRSKVWVESEGRIVHLLPDDRRPPRHQLCLVELDWGHTIKISHNVDLAPKVPWKKGDRLEFRGRFEWNDKGGVVHWTHHDPKGRKQGGWLRYAGKEYR
ncbi:MAG: DUF3465 domain-containing protein [Planctomycetota bacterium]|nr:DUF3465 domain-containing protein [Planctomycetota bacterium]